MKFRAVNILVVHVIEYGVMFSGFLADGFFACWCVAKNFGCCGHVESFSGMYIFTVMDELKIFVVIAGLTHSCCPVSLITYSEVKIREAFLLVEKTTVIDSCWRVCLCQAGRRLAVSVVALKARSAGLKSSSG